MQHNVAFHQCLHCQCKTDLQTKEYNIYFNYNGTPLDIYNGLSQVNKVVCPAGLEVLFFYLNLPLLPCFVYVRIECSDETLHLSRVV